MQVTGKFTIDCSRCGRTYDYTPEKVNFVPTEKKDGAQCYVWNEVFNCVVCSNHIEIKYEVCISDLGEVKDKKVIIAGAEIEDDSFSFSL